MQNNYASSIGLLRQTSWTFNELISQPSFFGDSFRFLIKILEDCFWVPVIEGNEEKMQIILS